jgi:hypothetical protein
MIEKTLTSIDESLKQIVTLLTAQQPTAEPQESQEKKPRAKKVDTPVATVGATVVVDEKKGSPATTTQQTAITAPTATAPAVGASAPDSTTSTPPWKDVLTAIQELNKSEKPGHGRDGVLAVLKQFGLEGQKVPKLETLGKHAEVLAFVKSLMATDASDDLGL